MYFKISILYKLVFVNDFSPSFHQFPVKESVARRYNEEVALMKNKRTAFLFITIILSFALLLSGCGEDIIADISDNYTEIYIPLPPAVESSFPPLSDEPQGGAPPSEEENATDSAPEVGEAPPNEDGLDASAPPIGADENEKLSEYDTYLAACATANVNVRSGAGTSHPILFTLQRGDSLPYVERVGSWLKVKTDRGEGYLHAAYAYLAETSAAIESVIRAGLMKLGTPYKWGAPRILTDKGTISPYFSGKSFDCSSFVQYCYYMGCGVKLGNYTGSQADYTVGEKIKSYGNLRRGDFYFTGTDKISHVVIYLGGGYLLQTYSANGGPVSVTTDERWKAKFLSGRRPDLTVTEQFR